MRKFAISILALVILAAILVGGCAKPTPAPSTAPAPTAAPPKTLDIGVAAPITGAAAFLGTNIQNGVLLAIDDQNKQGGITIGGQKYTLNPIVLDTKLDVVVGKSVGEELVYDKGVKVVAGPFLFDTVGVQSVTEKNKVLLFAVAPLTGLISPDKPYTFFPGGLPLMMAITPAAYIQKFYPQAKTVVTMTTDAPSIENWIDAAQIVSKRYGFTWLGVEKFPIDTKDFMPYVSRALAKNPDIIDMGGTGGDMGATSALLIKQLREAGFTGIISAAALPPPDVTMEVVPAKDRTKLVTTDIILDSPIVSQAYKDMSQRYAAKFGTPPIEHRWRIL